jgi:hypothetical protein
MTISNILRPDYQVQTVVMFMKFHTKSLNVSYPIAFIKICLRIFNPTLHRENIMKNIMNRAHLEGLSIRHLKQLASGKGITKAGYGKPWSDMCKTELVQALSDYHRIMTSAPTSRNWQTIQPTNRINTTSADGQPWTTCIGFETQAQAYRFFYWLLPQCSWALVRKGERTGSPYEVKVWGMSQALLDELITRDTPKVKPPALDDRSTWGIAPQPRAETFCGVGID